MASKTYITPEEAEYLLEEDEAYGGFVDRISGPKHRWYNEYLYIFKKDGRFYQARYDEGVTEEQESDWHLTDGEIECPEVESYEKTVAGWKIKK